MLTATLAMITFFSMGVGLGVAIGALVGAATGAVGTGAGTGAAGAVAIASSAMAGGAVSAGARQNHTPAAMPAMVNVATKAIQKRLC